jgi:hypothetical protein
VFAIKWVKVVIQVLTNPTLITACHTPVQTALANLKMKATSDSSSRSITWWHHDGLCSILTASRIIPYLNFYIVILAHWALKNDISFSNGSGMSIDEHMSLALKLVLQGFVEDSGFDFSYSRVHGRVNVFGGCRFF